MTRVHYFFLLLVSALLCQTEGFVMKYQTRSKSLKLRNDLHTPVEEIHAELSRLKRAAGKRIEQKSTMLNNSNPFAIVEYSGNDSKVIFVLTYTVQNFIVTASTLFRSDDYGYTFSDISSRVGGGATLGNRIYLSPENNKKVYLVDATRSIIYVSADEGVTFQTRNLQPNTINPFYLEPHPTVEDWVLGLDSTKGVLYVSRDFGKTEFTLISNNVKNTSEYQWGEAPYDNNSVIYYNTNSQTNPENEVQLYTQRYPYDKNSRKEFDTSLGSHNDFALVDRYIFVQKIVNEISSLWVSVDRKPFQIAKIPANVAHQGYLVQSIKSLQAMVIVYHNDNRLNLYVSEENGVLYSLALSDITYLIQFGYIFVDLELIESTNYTTYIANQNVRQTPTDNNPVVRTLISYDAGGNWHVLTPPTQVDSECVQPLCSLHLHMSSSEYWRTGVYSQESAPGIIIAHGVVGKSLNTIDITNLYISRDGGSTWSMTLSGTWGVALLDLGGLIIAAKDFHNEQDESRTLMYTCDEGYNWQEYQFTNKDVIVVGVITEPGESTAITSLYAVSSGSWVIHTINFTNIFDRMCTNDDYYTWIPFDQTTETGCLLGASVQIERRKPSVCCLNGHNYNREISFTVCDCTEEDFECDYGFKHANGINGPCIRDNDVVTLSGHYVNGSLIYTQSQGYYKIGGDVCTGGIEDSYAPYVVTCHQVSSSPSTATTFELISTVTITVVSTVTIPASPITVVSTVTIPAPSSGKSKDSNSSGNSTTAIILGCVLVVAFIILGIFIIVAVVMVIMKIRNSRSDYSRVPISYHNDRDSPQPISLKNDDDDDEPLPL